MPIPSRDVAVMDRNAEALGVPTARLMENAGRAVARAVQEHHRGGAVLVLAGRGNNGGDGAVAARHLKEAGLDVQLVVVSDEPSMGTRIAQDALDAASDSGVPVMALPDVDLDGLVRQAAVVVDAMLGVGVRGELREPVRSIVQKVEGAGRDVVAVDIPTGHGTSTPLRAQVTVTMHDRKEGMQEEACGRIVVADIGIPEEASRFVGPGDLQVRYPRTPDDAHKGKMGKILVVGGGPYTGAPTLVAMGACATGVDLVHMALPKDAARVAQVNLVEAIVHPLQGQRLSFADGPFVEGLLEEADVLVVGPGLGKDPDTLLAVRALVKKAAALKRRCVVDADVFAAFKGEDPTPLRSSGFVLTPHAGEWLTLTGSELPDDEKGRVHVVQKWIEDGDCVVLLKGKHDLIVSRDGYRVNRVHHPVMTTGGTGDVLAGVTAALLGRGMTPFDAACLTAYLNGSAGIMAFEDLGYGVRARDVARRIPRLLAHTFSEKGQG